MAGRRKHVVRQGKRKSTTNTPEEFSKKQKKHLKEFGEIHPSEERDTVKKYTKVIDTPEENVNDGEGSGSEGSGSEEESAYHQLVSTLSRKNMARRNQVASSDESSDENEGENDDLSTDDDMSDDDDSVDAHKANNLKEDKETADDVDSDVEGSENDEQNDHDEDNIDDDENDQEDTVDDNLADPFSRHFEIDLPDKFVEEIASNKNLKKETIKISHVGKAVCSWHSDEFRQSTDKTVQGLNKLYVKQKLCQQVIDCNRRICAGIIPPGESLTKHQLEVFKILNSYQDLYYPDRTPQRGEELRLVYSLHALNHILKTRSRIVAHSAKIKSRSKNDPDLKDYRDQGLTRPKVLIVLPFRDSALKVVNLITELLMNKEQTFVSNKNRFESEYGETVSVKKGLKPEDYEATFSGNIDDHFRIGLGVAKKTLKLYTDFYTSDIILASPLGLRTMIGGDGEKTECDFLSSIEVLIFDQTDVFLMQNWDHIQYLMEHLHLQPKEGHGVDFSRLRMWTLNGWAKYYRQTLIFSNVISPEINSLFNKSCHNYGGKMTVSKPNAVGTICQIVVQLPQVFQRIDCSSFTDLADSRFQFFIKKVLPHHKDPVMSQTLIFIPSYFDYVRIRNYFVKEDVNFVSICEYSNNKVISKSRNQFYHGKVHFMLYTERIHFFRRFKLRGIKHILFYGLPVYPHFYSEMCNVMRDPSKNTEQENLSSTIIYSKYEAQKLAAIVGLERTSRMLSSEKNVHMFVTGEES